MPTYLVLPVHSESNVKKKIEQHENVTIFPCHYFLVVLIVFYKGRLPALLCYQKLLLYYSSLVHFASEIALLTHLSLDVVL